MTTTTTAPALYSFKGHDIRTVRRPDGSHWFVAQDIARALGHRDATQAVRILEEEEKGSTRICTPGGPQVVLTVNESGLYALTFRSRKPEARAFRLWATKTVIPSLHRHGLYMVGQELPVPENMTEAEIHAHMAPFHAQLLAIEAGKVAEARERQRQYREDHYAAHKMLRRFR
jgi:prophage antirepressor-like protein